MLGTALARGRLADNDSYISKLTVARLHICLALRRCGAVLADVRYQEV